MINKQEETIKNSFFIPIKSESESLYSTMPREEFYSFNADSWKNFKKLDFDLPYLINIGLLSYKYKEETSNEITNLINDLEEVLNTKEYVSVPAVIPLLGDKNIVFYNNVNSKHHIEEIIFRTLTSIPVGFARYTLIDSIGLGENFSKFSSLDKKLIGDMILHDDKSINKVLDELINLIATLIQKYLGNKYNNIEEYNKDAGEVSEPYRFLVISNFPSGFNEDSMNKLYKIMENGNKIGIYTVMSVDTSLKTPYGFDINKYKNSSTVIQNNKILIDEFENFELVPSEFLEKSIFDKIINQINESAQNIKQREVKFDNVVATKLWADSTKDGIKVPIGRLGAKDIQYFNLIEVYHALIGGATGSGKTVLLHTLINSLASHYSPDEIQMYLLDYKEGTEFIVYKELPQMKVLAIESERLFGLSVLQGISDELSKRGEEFKRYEANNLKEYIDRSGSIVSRIVVIIDEFQVLLSGNDTISVKSKKLMDDIVRRGRSFGVHLILSTQTLAGIDLDSGTMSNIGLRVALKMNENDSTRILSKDNPDAKYLNVGEAIYNDKHGLPESNTKFQVAMLKEDEKRENIQKIVDKAKLENYQHNPKIFDGSSGADIKTNEYFKSTIKPNNNFCKVYIGEPNFLSDEHVHFKLKKQYQSNLLIVGSEIEDSVNIVKSVFYSILQASVKGTKIYSLELLNIDSDYKDSFKLFKSDDNVECLHGDNKQLEKYINEIHEELKARMEDDEKEQIRIILSIFNLQRAMKLKKDGFNQQKALKQFLEIIKEGSEYGIHTIIYAQAYSQISDFLDNKYLNEFENKIALDGGDSQKLFANTNSSMQKVNPKTGLLLSNENKFDIDSFKVYESIIMD